MRIGRRASFEALLNSEAKIFATEQALAKNNCTEQANTTRRQGKRKRLNAAVLNF